jgi:hypothetical protein
MATSPSRYPLARAALPILVGRPAIPSSEVGSLRTAVRRTLVLRLLLAAALAGILVAAFLAARRLEVRQGGFAPVGRTGIVVLDLSTSVDIDANRRIRRVLGQIVNGDEPVGLVLFSDTGYEAVPPGTRGSELRPLLKFFSGDPVSEERRAELRRRAFQRNPWAGAFRGGTRISGGLRVARAALRREGLADGSVVLVSDLDYSPFDLGPLTQTLIDYRVDKIPLRIVPLFPSFADRQFFSRLLGGDAFVSWKELAGRAHGGSRASFAGSSSRTLVLLGLALVLLLAVNEVACGRLSLPRGRRANEVEA